MPHRNQTYRNTVAVLSLISACVAASPALAEKASLRSMSFSADAAQHPIHVISTDKARWNALKPGGTQFQARMKIDTKHPGMVYSVSVFLGECEGGSCNSLPVLWSDDVVARDYDHAAAIGLPTSKIGVSGTGITLGDQIIARCNQNLQADGPTKSHGFTQQIPVAFAADTEKVWGNVDNYPVEAMPGSWPYPLNQVDHVRSGTVSVEVVCDAVVKPVAGDMAYDHGDFDVESVRLFLTTYHNSQPGSNPGTVCPALKVTSRAKANQSGPVTMRIWRQKGNGPITSQVKQAWASFDAAKNGYFATYETFENVGTTSTFQFKTEIVEDSIFAPFDGWKDITVHCTNPGGGGLAPAPQNDPDQPRPRAEWQGELTVADSAGADKSCPRKGQVFFAATRAEPGDFQYRISCSNGAFFKGTATAYDQGSGVFEAYGAHDISVNRTRSIQCTLQELQPAPVTVATGGQDFTCNNPAIDPDADHLTADPKPNPAKPARPQVVVDPAPACDRGEKLVRGKCVAKPVIVQACGTDETRLNGKCVNIPGVSIHCLPGFKQVGKQCFRKPAIVADCRRDEQRIDGKCAKKPEVSILCKTGFKLQGKECVRKPVIATACTAGERLVRGNCIKTTPAPAAKVKRFAAPATALEKKAAKAFKLPAPRKPGRPRG